jgi:hypothetical protein
MADFGRVFKTITHVSARQLSLFAGSSAFG